jgi:FKBP-type peptidyl-prolyl cis-trans isomerase (trigger factor)
MRDALSRSCEELVANLNRSAKREAAVKALLAANPFSVSEEEIDNYVLKEIQKLKSQVGEEFFGGETHDIDALKKVVRRDVGHIPQLNIILAVIAAEKDFIVTNGDRKEEIARQRAQSIKPEMMESVDQTMEALAANPEMLEALDYKITLNKALDYVVEETDYTVKAGLTLREAVPKYLRGI